jgi:hypothetical protein
VWEDFIEVEASELHDESLVDVSEYLKFLSLFLRDIVDAIEERDLLSEGVVHEQLHELNNVHLNSELVMFGVLEGQDDHILDLDELVEELDIDVHVFEEDIGGGGCECAEAAHALTDEIAR